MGASPATLGGALNEAASHLAAAGVERARRDARLLLAAAAGVEPGTIVAWPERSIDEEKRRTFDDFVRRRAAHEPVSRILGCREFWSLPFALSAATLDPRPDSEILVEALLARLDDRRAPLRLLDLGTGSGCLLLALLSELPNAWGVGVDLVPEAAATARRNAVSLGLAERASFLAGSWAEALDGAFDLIISNPPYIARDGLAELDPEVRLYDPRAALDGGDDGLDAYRALAALLPRVLQPQGVAAIEIGAHQAKSAAAVLSATGLAAPVLLRDLAGRPRGLLFHALNAGCPL